MALGTILYVALLLTNAIAVLSEERFLAKGEFGRTSLFVIDCQKGPSRKHQCRLVGSDGCCDRKRQKVEAGRAKGKGNAAIVETVW